MSLDADQRIQEFVEHSGQQLLDDSKLEQLHQAHANSEIMLWIDTQTRKLLQEERDLSEYIPLLEYGTDATRFIQTTTVSKADMVAAPMDLPDI